jgi:hypothetical protein
MVLIAKHKRNGETLDIINTIGGGKSKTARSVYDECNKRLATLTLDQIDLIIQGDLMIQKQIAFLAVCKFHAFIRDFTVEVVREKYLTYDYQLTEGEYRTFFTRKSELHPEMEKLTPRSQEGIRQVTFKMLEQAGIIDNIKSKNIQMQFIEPHVIMSIKKDHPDWLKIFLLSDTEIMNLTS